MCAGSNTCLRGTVPCMGTLWACLQEPHTAHLCRVIVTSWLLQAHGELSLPIFPLFLSSLLPPTVYEPSLLNPVSPVLCQSVSNLQLLRLFSSLLPLGSVSGTVSLFFYLFTVPLPSLSLHPAHPLIQPVLSELSSLSFCQSSLLTHFSHEVKFRVLIIWP